MSFLLAKDGLSGKKGKGFATISGRNVELFGLKKFESSAEFEDAKFTVVGTTKVQHKPKEMNLTGSMTVYYGTPEFIKIAHDYQTTGYFPPITLQITNDDPGASVGVQTVAFYDVVLSKIPLALLDDSADFLEEEVSWSASSFEILSSFNAPASLGSN